MSVSVITNLVENHSLILKDSLDEYMCVFDSSILEKYTCQWKYNRNLDTEKMKKELSFEKAGVVFIPTVFSQLHPDDRKKGISSIFI